MLTRVYRRKRAATRRRSVPPAKRTGASIFSGIFSFMVGFRFSSVMKTSQGEQFSLRYDKVLKIRRFNSSKSFSITVRLNSKFHDN